MRSRERIRCLRRLIKFLFKKGGDAAGLGFGGDEGFFVVLGRQMVEVENTSPSSENSITRSLFDTMISLQTFKPPI